MRELTCKVCGKAGILNRDGTVACLNCSCEYILNEAKNMGADQVLFLKEKLKLDDESVAAAYCAAARDAFLKGELSGAKRLYTTLASLLPNNTEANFFKLYLEAYESLADSNYSKREQNFKALNKFISVLTDYYKLKGGRATAELQLIVEAIVKIQTAEFVFDSSAGALFGGCEWQREIIKATKFSLQKELTQLGKLTGDEDIKNLAFKL